VHGTKLVCFPKPTSCPGRNACSADAVMFSLRFLPALRCLHSTAGWVGHILWASWGSEGCDPPKVTVRQGVPKPKLHTLQTEFTCLPTYTPFWLSRSRSFRNCRWQIRVTFDCYPENHLEAQVSRHGFIVTGFHKFPSELPFAPVSDPQGRLQKAAVAGIHWLLLPDFCSPDALDMGS
jgi:hypothetical protein